MTQSVYTRRGPRASVHRECHQGLRLQGTRTACLLAWAHSACRALSRSVPLAACPAAAKAASGGQGSCCLFPSEMVQRALANAGSQASLRLCC